MTSSPTSTLIVVDPTVENYQSLIASASPNAEVLILDTSRNGVEQITAALAGKTGVESLHIVSHGESGQLQLGAAQLSARTLSLYAEQLKSWSTALTADADILLYGCNVAAGDIGTDFVQTLGAITGADIAASIDLTGNAALGGNWVLEASTGDIQSFIAFEQSVLDRYDSVLQTVLVSETFTGATLNSGPWLFGRGTTATQFDPFLTARSTTAPDASGIPGSPTGVALDPDGQGALRLTSADRDEASFVIYDTPVESNAGLSITFDLFAYGGTGADGIGFFLIDGSQSPSVAGGFGGSFGYAPRNVDGIAGLQGGYLGIGFDAYGNFSSTETTFRGSQKTTGPGRIPDSIAVRGSQQTDYAYLTGTGSLPRGIDNSFNGAVVTNREDARRRVNVELSRTGVLSVRIDLNGDDDFNDPGELVIDSFDAIAANSPVPDTFKFGFSGSTGSQTNIHEVRNFLVETLSQPPQVANVNLSLNQGETVNVTGLNATDPDGVIVAYFIDTLPPANQGTLFLGNPNAGGTALVEGQEISPAQIGQIFFRGTPEFFGNGGFTYNAIDDSGSVAATPGTVALSVQGVLDFPPEPEFPEQPPADPGCLPGLTLVGTAGNDRIEGSADSDTIRGLAGNDVLLGLECGDILEGGLGNDRLIGDGGNDLLRGNQGDDILRGGQGVDVLFGNLGNDDLDGGSGDDFLDGGAGNDIVRGKRGNDVLRGNDGNDVLEGGAGNDDLDGGLGNDILRGGGNQDILRGRQGEDRLFGGRGDDNLFGNLGDDRLDGGLGDDRLNGGVGNDVLFGRQGDDLLRGKEGDDVLYGNRGNDVLQGEEGDDLLVGGPGQDIMTGGTGADRFFFVGVNQDAALRQSTGAAPDQITDFNFSEGDKVLLSYENNLGALTAPTGLFNAGTITARNIIRAGRRAFRDKNQEAEGNQRLQAREAVFFEWRNQTFLVVNNNVPGYGFRDLTVNMTGINFKPGDQAAGVLNVTDYFAV
ncbi:DUF4347 domain-containing protein [Oculatella sp. LEGE 06141]|uniref:DUF4347 domain-containing protein n=1 Tax=Oculatella sp. LEGE 06141 TaxID=1828648 RepID=UPI001880DA61|nr:DUF4347 domain-containing protein [Oculatella sp. LEGE 06141]MBE9181779.1 DUF4347 domain-containing protein [Oculatella sp. LEGE 06141]